MPHWTPIIDRCHFTLTGTDRTRYLNGQVTNQVENLPADLARYACVTDRKGRLEADLFITSWPDQQWLMLESAKALQEDLFTRLDRYIIADDAELTDVTGLWQTYHILTFPNEQSLIPKLPHHRATNSQRFGAPGIDITLPVKEAKAFLTTLTDTLGPASEPESFNQLRLQHGIPRWGSELTPGLLPPEARLETRAIDYAKGCYTGQEVISRIKSAGKVNRMLSLFTVDPTAQAIALGHKIISTDEIDPEPIGTITSLGQAPSNLGPDRGERLALGYLKRHHAAAGEGQAFIARSTDGTCSSHLTLQTFPPQHS